MAHCHVNAGPAGCLGQYLLSGCSTLLVMISEVCVSPSSQMLMCEVWKAGGAAVQGGMALAKDFSRGAVVSLSWCFWTLQKACPSALLLKSCLLWWVIFLHLALLCPWQDWVTVTIPDLLPGSLSSVLPAFLLDITVPNSLSCLTKAGMTARWELLCWLPLCVAFKSSSHYIQSDKW